MPSERPAPYRLTLLGPWDLRGPDDEKVRSVLSQPKRLCLLAYLALCGEPVSRSTLVALFWPDSDEERARNALSQALHYLRRSLTPKAVESVEGDRLIVSPKWVWFDARVLLDSDEAAAAAVAEPVRQGRDFFQGWNAEDSQPLQDWLDGVRLRVGRRGVEVGAGAVAQEVTGEPEVAARKRAEAGSSVARGVASMDGVDVGAGGGAARRRFIRLGWAGGGLLLGALLTVLVIRLGMGPSDAVATSPVPPPTVPNGGGPVVAPAVAILLPRVTVLGEGPDVPAQAFAVAVHEELVARMGDLSGVRVVSVGFEDEIWELLRSLEAQGSDRLPEWVVSIGIRSGGGQARVVALLHRGPDYTSAWAVSAEDYSMPDAAEGLVQLPQEIAADVAAGVAEAVGTGQDRF